MESGLENMNCEGDQRLATILAIGTANPPNIHLQSQFPDFLFRVTNTEHLVELKHKFKRLCDNSNIIKRHMLIDEDLLKEHPNISTYGAPSMDTRREIINDYIPKLGTEAALKALKEWGQPLSKITHFIFCTSSCVNHIPGPDFYLAKEIGLPPTVNRLVIYDHGCHAGGSVLRVAKAFAESIPGSRVLTVCSETMATSFQTPSPKYMGLVIGHAIFGDGAAAMVIGADPIRSIECSLFKIVSTSQQTVEGTEKAIHLNASEMGQIYFIAREIPSILECNVKKCIFNAFGSLGITINDNDFNSLFYVVHPGAKIILNVLDRVLGLKEEKLAASRTILKEFGNMWSSSVFFVLDEMRKKSSNEGKTTTGEGCKWGALMTFGPGMIVETVVIQSVSLKDY
ncbi:chalcone synthase-like [Senna tora]|uniref:Chalcone synthase-like n=1 Tax=Senna tora TaxID=362788 RepID=A0A834TLY0_9FABA|nr:chalcone synthase-like [Senna tora]